MERYRYRPELQDIFEKSCVPFAVYQLIDMRVVTIVLSDGFREMFGFKTLEEAYRVMDNDMYRDAHPDDVSEIADAAVRFAIHDEPYNVVYRTMVNGEYRIVHAQGKHVETEKGIRLAEVWYTDEGPYNPDAKVFVSTLNRSFSKALHEDSIYHRNHYDHLTGTPSMTYFLELAEAGKRKMYEKGLQPVMLFWDLCGMRQFNRKYGFEEGGRLIRSVSKVLVEVFSNENCSHFEQDHFAVYTDTRNLEERLKAVFEKCTAINNGRTRPIRVGIYVCEHPDIDASTACDRAKVACDYDRKAYVSCFRYFDNSMLVQAEKRQYIIDNLDRALSEGWIKVYYQPIVRAANGKVCEEEALARWIDPEKGYIKPSEFISYLEEAKLVYKLDLFVVEQVLEKMNLQAKAGLYVVPESINLSRADFDSCDIVEEIKTRVDSAGISREKLTIEITESIIGSDPAFMKEQVNRFHSLGFKVWMDDFGSGYSSLDLLQEIRFDLIKLDMRFMSQFKSSEQSKVIITELTRMAIALGIETVAEGVETQEQVDFLKEVGCTKLQGFYFCGANSAEEILARYREGRQIGFENPEESEYYSSIGRVNLYDLSAISAGDETLRPYFKSLPLAIVECVGNEVTVLRGNDSYKEFMTRYSSSLSPGRKVDITEKQWASMAVVKALRQSVRDGSRKIFDEKLADGSVVHALLRRIAVNPVTKASSLVVVILAITDINGN